MLRHPFAQRPIRNLARYVCIPAFRRQLSSVKFLEFARCRHRFYKLVVQVSTYQPVTNLSLTAHSDAMLNRYDTYSILALLISTGMPVSDWTFVPERFWQALFTGVKHRISEALLYSSFPSAPTSTTFQSFHERV